MTTGAAAPPERGRMTGLSHDADGEPVPLAQERARPRRRLEDPFIGWTATLSITLVSLFLRLWKLGTPHAFEFDETYYAKDAWSLWHFGYARDYIDNDGGVANKHILNGQSTHLWKPDASMVVHPEVGKWLIGLGEKLFGFSPLGWRVVPAVIGTLLILVMIRFVRRLTGSTLLGCIAGLILSFDGLEFVLSRLALLDIFVAFFLLCAVHCLVLDRDWYRARLAALVPGQVEDDGWGPVKALLFRPWLLVSGICWGLACGSKWEAIYPLAAFGVLVVAWCAGARKSFGVTFAGPKSLLADGVPAFVHLVLVGLIVYLATWTGWLMHSSQYVEYLSDTQYTHYVSGGSDCGKNITFDNSKHWPTAGQPVRHGLPGLVQGLESLWYYHRDVYVFHTQFLTGCTHTYASQPRGWLLLNRPVGVDAETGIKPGTGGCDAPQGSDCLRQVILLGTPAVWWAGVLALIASLFWWIGARDWRFGIAVVGAASTWLPWFLYDGRPIFSFYSIITLPFLVLALTLVIGKLLGPSTAPTPRRTVGVVAAGSYVVLVMLNFAWFWPIYTDALLTHAEWLQRIWFSRWI
ncbi:dolichyl-phosphate-mannose--protein mannosyltransferase [Nocardioides sp.]|uniref:dolichyl-phosphate-mannose--protein mannosyltransferase n=1 Tax=Nocardioides sp. TaxID=35761 RepID=UPI002F421188